MGVSGMNMALYFNEANKYKKLKKEVEDFLDQYDILVDRYNYYDSENEELVIPTREISILMRDFAKTVKEC